MGLQYRPIRIAANGKNITTVGIIDTGADETVISPYLAELLQCKLWGEFSALSATGHEIIGQYTTLSIISDEWHNISIIDYQVGVVKEPFREEGDEGVHIILGVDFLQDTEYELKFKNQ